MLGGQHLDGRVDHMTDRDADHSFPMCSQILMTLKRIKAAVNLKISIKLI